MKPSASYVIVEKRTGFAILETFDKKLAEKIDAEKYEAVPVLEYLYGLNAKIKAGKI